MKHSKVSQTTKTLLGYMCFRVIRGIHCAVKTVFALTLNSVNDRLTPLSSCENRHIIHDLIFYLLCFIIGLQHNRKNCFTLRM